MARKPKATDIYADAMSDLAAAAAEHADAQVDYAVPPPGDEAPQD